MPYLFDHAWQAERERLAGIEKNLDPFTIECLERIGVGEGWRCLEVGAGGGSIAEWLCRRVGAGGQVVATDLQTQFLEAVEAPNLAIRRHDVTREEFEPDAFDLVSARKVLEHLADPRAALARMYAAVRPGGWLLVEDTDLASVRHVTTRRPELFERGYTRFVTAMSSAGYQPTLGIRLGDELRAVGLEGVQVRGTTTEWSAGAGKVYRMTFARLRDRVVASGLLTGDEVDEFLAELEAPGFHAITSIHFAAWGRKPAGP